MRSLVSIAKLGWKAYEDPFWQDVGVYGEVDPVYGYAGWFEGQTKVTGKIEAGCAYFHIDHPHDPDNKYLNHSYIASPENLLI